jgi:hypothetical protein
MDDYFKKKSSEEPHPTATAAAEPAQAAEPAAATAE